MVIATSISPAVRAKLGQLVRDLDSAAARAEAAAKAARGGALSQMFQRAIGTDSTVAAAESKARAQRNLATAVRGKVERLQLDADALVLLREAVTSRWADLGDLEQLARSLTLGGAAKRVAADSAKDAARIAVEVGENAIGVVKLVPAILLGLGLWWAWKVIPWGQLDAGRRAANVMRAARDGLHKPGEGRRS